MNITKTTLAVLIAGMILLLVTAIISGMTYVRTSNGLADMKVITEPKDLVDILSHKDSWAREDDMLEYSRCWVHWISQNGEWIVKDAVFCVPK